MITCLTITGKRYEQFEARAKTCRDSQAIGHHSVIYRDESCPGCSVGKLRNVALQFISADTEQIAHFDVDDWSAPDRLLRQLAHIQKTGKLVTGFWNMPLYDATNDKVWIYENQDHRFALGTSLFYRREAWERVKFPDKTPEDNQWRREVGYDNCESQSVFREDGTPIMVQVVHGGNASARIVPSSARFKEASPQVDAEVRRMLSAAR